MTSATTLTHHTPHASDDKPTRPFISGRKLRQARLVSRDIAAKALRSAFPAPSDNQVCERAAAVLDTSPQTIRRILNKETDARWSLIWPVLMMALAAKGIDALDLIGVGP